MFHMDEVHCFVGLGACVVVKLNHVMDRVTWRFPDQDSTSALQGRVLSPLSLVRYQLCTCEKDLRCLAHPTENFFNDNKYFGSLMLSTSANLCYVGFLGA